MNTALKVTLAVAAVPAGILGIIMVTSDVVAAVSPPPAPYRAQVIGTPTNVVHVPLAQAPKLSLSVGSGRITVYNVGTTPLRDIDLCVNGKYFFHIEGPLGASSGPETTQEQAIAILERNEYPCFGIAEADFATKDGIRFNPYHEKPVRLTATCNGVTVEYRSK